MCLSASFLPPFGDFWGTSSASVLALSFLHRALDVATGHFDLEKLGELLPPRVLTLFTCYIFELPEQPAKVTAIFVKVPTFAGIETCAITTETSTMGGALWRITDQADGAPRLGWLLFLCRRVENFLFPGEPHGQKEFLVCFFSSSSSTDKGPC